MTHFLCNLWDGPAINFFDSSVRFWGFLVSIWRMVRRNRWTYVLQTPMSSSRGLIVYIWMLPETAQLIPAIRWYWMLTPRGTRLQTRTLHDFAMFRTQLLSTNGEKLNLLNRATIHTYFQISHRLQAGLPARYVHQRVDAKKINGLCCSAMPSHFARC